VTYNAANRKDVRRLEKQARLDERARQETVKGLMGSAQGRQWVYERLTLCHVFASSFSINALEAAFKEGERNVGLQLLNDVMTCPDEYVLMMREANVRDLTASERSRSEDPGWGDQERDEPSGEPAGDPDSFAEAG
jgi:hypothetical protein